MADRRPIDDDNLVDTDAVLFDQSFDAVMVIRGGGTVVRWNAAAEEMLSQSGEQMSALHLSALHLSAITVPRGVSNIPEQMGFGKDRLRPEGDLQFFRTPDDEWRVAYRLRQIGEDRYLLIISSGPNRNLLHDLNNSMMGILGTVDLALADAAEGSPTRHFLVPLERSATRAANIVARLRTRRLESPAPASVPAPERKGRVLVADEDDTVRRTAAAILARLGYHTVVAADAVMTLELFRGEQTRFDMVLLDFTLESNGIGDLVEDIRAADGEVPIIVMSGYGGAQLGSRLSEMVSGFLPKPFRAAQLQNILESLVKPPSEESV